MPKEKPIYMIDCCCGICVYLYKGHCLITGDEMNADDECTSPEHFYRGIPEHRAKEARKAGFYPID